MNFPQHLKKTKARLSVYDLFMHQNELFTVDKLHQALPDIHIATLYRIVEEFVKAGVLRLSDDFNPKQRQYQLKPQSHQHKLKCLDCNQEFILESCPLHIHAPNGFVVLDHRIEIEGLCKNCAEKREKK